MPRADFVEIHVGNIAGKQQLHKALADALGFPVWYGKNWDALGDAITGLVEMPIRLRLAGWQRLESRLPKEAAMLRGILDEMAEKFSDAAAEVVYG